MPALQVSAQLVGRPFFLRGKPFSEFPPLNTSSSYSGGVGRKHLDVAIRRTNSGKPMFGALSVSLRKGMVGRLPQRRRNCVFGASFVGCILHCHWFRRKTSIHSEPQSGYESQSAGFSSTVTDMSESPRCTRIATLPVVRYSFARI